MKIKVQLDAFYTNLQKNIIYTEKYLSSLSPLTKAIRRGSFSNTKSYTFLYNTNGFKNWKSYKPKVIYQKVASIKALRTTMFIFQK